MTKEEKTHILIDLYVKSAYVGMRKAGNQDVIYDMPTMALNLEAIDLLFKEEYRQEARDKFKEFFYAGN